ncbi:MAG: TetR/AcrR family transcriptional regulator [Myxococcota bacterium]
MGRHPLTHEEIEAERARVVQAAEALFAAHGYEGVTLRALAQALGRSHTAAYRYFEGKAEIFAATRIAAYRRFAEAQEQALRATDDHRERLSRLGESYIRFGLESPDAYRLMFELKRLADSDATREAEDRAWQPLRDAVSDAIDAGDLQGDPDVVAHLLWAGLHGLLSLHLAGKLRHGVSFEDLAQPMRTMLRVGNLGTP